MFRPSWRGTVSPSSQNDLPGGFSARAYCQSSKAKGAGEDVSQHGTIVKLMLAQRHTCDLVRVCWYSFQASFKYVDPLAIERR